MTTPLVLPDPVVDLKPWVIAHSRLAPLHGGRVYWQFPATIPGYPAIRLYDVIPPLVQPGGGGVPVVEAHVGFDIWGGSRDDFVAVKTLATTITAVLHELQPDTVIGSTLVKNADVVTAAFSPDPATGDPRYVIDGSFYCVTAP